MPPCPGTTLRFVQRLGTCICIILAVCLAGCAALQPQAAAPAPAPGGAEELGIEVVAVRASANGYMVDFRYRVQDPEKSAPLFDRGQIPFIIDEATGARFMVPNPPKVGPLRQTTVSPEPGRTYFILFANPGKYLQPGNRITVAIGDRRIEHLVIE